MEITSSKPFLHKSTLQVNKIENCFSKKLSYT